MDEPLAHEAAGVVVAPSPDEVDAFALALTGMEGTPALARLLGRGRDGWLRREVFAPAARRLGDWWVEDRICFATVTLGMAELQRLAWAHGRAPPAWRSPLHPPMLLAAVPGEQHTFGLNLLMEDLRARGVEPAFLASPTREGLVTAAARGAFEIIGLSVGSDDRLAEVAALAHALRAAASKPLRLLLGGCLAAGVDPRDAGVDEVLHGEGAIERLCELAAASTPRHAVAA